MQKIRRVQMRKPGSTDLTNFTEFEMVFINDPLFPSVAVGQYNQYKDKLSKQQSKSTRHKFQACIIKET